MSNKIRLEKEDFPSLGDYLRENGLVERVSIAAEKRALSRQFAADMKEQEISKSSMALRMGTSRAQLDRLLNPLSQNVSLETLARAARVLGRRLRIELV